MAHQFRQIEHMFVFLVIFGILLLLIPTSVLYKSSSANHNSFAWKAKLSRNVLRDVKHSNGDDTSNSTLGTWAEMSSPTTVLDPAWLKGTPKSVAPVVATRQHPLLSGYLIENPRLCQKVSVDLLIVVHSAVPNFQLRRSLRETWANTAVFRNISIKTIFVLGKSVSKNTQLRLNTEQAAYGDLVQGDFVDEFSNLTRKALTALRWVNDHCVHARYVLKADDDIFVNVFALAEYLLPRLAGAERAVLCNVKPNNTSIIERAPGKRWSLPKHLLPGRKWWPTFCTGFVIVLTTDLIPLLYNASFAEPFYPVDDTFLYGVLPEKWPGMLLQRQDLNGNVTLVSSLLLKQYENFREPVTYVAGNAPDEASQSRLWRATIARLTPWGKSRASISHLWQSMGPSNL